MLCICAQSQLQDLASLDRANMHREVRRLVPARTPTRIEMGVLADIRAAAARIAVPGGAVRTAVLPFQHTLAPPNVECHVKCEHLQRTGSFKFRGALSAVFALSAADAKRGFVAHSSGNHGAAVAAAASARGVPATIVVPNTTPAAKLENIKRYGANLVLLSLIHI